MKRHHQAIHKILRYLKGNPSSGIFFETNNKVHLKAFSDSNLASCFETRRSTIGFCIFLGTSLVSRKTRKQSTVSRSSSEVEYRALITTTCELQWLTYLITNLHVKDFLPSALYCDNQAARHIAHNLSFHERTKHINLFCHVVREKLKEKLFQLLPIRTSLHICSQNLWSLVVSKILFQSSDC